MLHVFIVRLGKWEILYWKERINVGVQKRGGGGGIGKFPES